MQRTKGLTSLPGSADGADAVAAGRPAPFYHVVNVGQSKLHDSFTTNFRNYNVGYEPDSPPFSVPAAVGEHSLARHQQSSQRRQRQQGPSAGRVVRGRGFPPI